MKEETAIELLKIATQLACATLGQNHYHTTAKTSTVEGVLDVCLKSIVAHHKNLTTATVK